MKNKIFVFSLVLIFLRAWSGSLSAQDVVFRTNGVTSKGLVKGIQTLFLQLEVEVAPDQPKAILSIPLVDIAHVDFGETTAVDEYLKSAGRERLLTIEKLWNQREDLLDLPESTAGAIGLKMAALLMDSALEKDHQLALRIYQRIEKEDWSEHRRARAREGRLRATVRLGRAAEAVDEAAKLAATSEDPGLLIEAKYVLAQASRNALNDLVEENPRWEEDDEVRPRRNVLFHETLDLFLFPYLFHASHTEEAARGLWGAVEVFQNAGETDQALGRATDLMALFPDTAFAGKAKEFIAEQKEKPTTEKGTTE